MDNYIDSMNYADILEAATHHLETANGETLQFFIEIKDQLRDTLDQVKDWYAQRDAAQADAGIFEYTNPDELSDFYDVSEDVVARNYDAWDEFCQASNVYGTDTRTLIDVITNINRAIDKIGEIE